MRREEGKRSGLPASDLNLTIQPAPHNSHQLTYSPTNSLTHREGHGEELGVPLDVVLLPDGRGEADAVVCLSRFGRVHVDCCVFEESDKGGVRIEWQAFGVLTIVGVRVKAASGLCPLICTPRPVQPPPDRQTDGWRKYTPFFPSLPHLPCRYLLARTKDDMMKQVKQCALLDNGRALLEW